MTILVKKTKIGHVDNFKKASKKFIENYVKEYTFDEAINMLKNERFYNFRIQKDSTYQLYGDLDNFDYDINHFFSILQNYLSKNYNISINIDDIKYTKNNDEIKKSFHYSIPKIFGTTTQLKTFQNKFKKYISKHDNIEEKNIDTTIYSNHWYRAPNQYKGETSKDCVLYNKHVIQKGTMLDFIPEYYEDDAYELVEVKKNKNSNDNIILNNSNNKLNYAQENISTLTTLIDFSSNLNENDTNTCEMKLTTYDPNNNTMSKILSKANLCQQLFDECYSINRFNEYESWISIAMAIKNTFSDDEAFKLFDYFSSKGTNYEGTIETRNKFQSFITKKDGYTIATIYYFAIEDNKPRFVEIIKQNTFDLEQTDICRYLKIISNDRFIYQTIKNQGGGEDKHKLYVYNGKYWENNAIIMKNIISTQLYDFLKKILIEAFWEKKDFNILKNKLDRLKQASFKKDIIETYKEYGINDDIKFDEQPYLFCFKNIVYDLKNGCFREHNYDDYITAHTGYNWRETTKEEIETVENLIKSIMPKEDERQTLLEILATGMDGLALEKFIVLNGAGGNGKGVLNDLFLTCLGNYGFIGNNAILFESGNTGSNPEKANIHKKRYVVFREPPANKKFNNAFIKELTGGGLLAARGHNETNTVKELNCTTVVECNERPRFSEEPSEADKRRLIDILYKSKFTNDEELINENNYIFKANGYYKTKEFQEKHKYALLHILFEIYKEVHKKYRDITIAQSIKERTMSYLELSCQLLPWFKENYELTNNKEDFIKISDIFELFKNSETYDNMSKYERKKYNKNFFLDYFEKNIVTRKYYKIRYNNIRNVLIEYKQISN